MTDYNWTGDDGTTDFSRAANWSPSGGPPAKDDNATISDSGTLSLGNAVQITQINTEVTNLTIDDGALNDTGFLFIVDNFLVVGGTSTSDLQPNSLLAIGGGGEIDAAYVDIGQGTGLGGSVTVDASTLKVTNSLVIGDQSVGQLFLYSGASVTAGTFISVGLSSGGLLAINGPNSIVTLNSTDSSGMDVGVNAGANGDVELNTNATLTISTFLEVGGDGQGTLGIHSGSVVNVGPLTNPIPKGTGDDLGIGYGGFLGNSSDGTSGFGQVYVDGAGSQLNVSRQIYVGGPTSNGGNLLQITSGAVVNADMSGDAQAMNIDGLAIAFESQLNQVLAPPGNPFALEDQVIVDGTGSELNVNGTIVVGVNGTGELDITNGAMVTGSDNVSGGMDVGVSGVGQFAGAQGTINVIDATFMDGSLKVGDAGNGTLYVADNSTVTLGSNLAIGAQSGSNGYVYVGDAENYPSDASSLTVGSINVGGDFGGPGGNGLLQVEASAEVSIASALNVWGGQGFLGGDPLGIVDLYDLGSGTVAVGAFPVDDSASNHQGQLVLNPTGTLSLQNGLIEGGVLDFNGGAFDVTPALSQIDDGHSVLQDVTIEGQDLTIANAVLTLAGTTNGAVGDNVLINVTGSLVDLSGLQTDNFGGESDLSQTINATDVALTVADPLLVIEPDPAVPGPTGGKIIGTGAIFSDYISPISDGYFSGDVALQNYGLIDAVYNDQGLDNSAQLSILTNTITNEFDGIFRADLGATLNIGGSGTPLDNLHMFTNLQNNDADQTDVLVDGAYVADGGNIDINGNDPVSGNPLAPLTTLSAVVYLSGELQSDGMGGFTTVSGDMSVNGVDIETSLTTITPSADSGEGDLILQNNFANNYNFWQNTIEIQGLTAAEVANYPTWTLEDGTSGVGGGLYLDNGLFNGARLIIDAANPSDPGSQSAFISGNGQINAPVTMNGIVYAQINTPNSTGSALWFTDPVTGSGQYFIEGGSTLWLNAGLLRFGRWQHRNICWRGQWFLALAWYHRCYRRLPGDDRPVWSE